MIKFLLVILIIIAVIGYVVYAILRFLRRMCSPLTQASNQSQTAENDNRQVLYNKDNGVVLKGEAKEKKEDNI